MTGAASGGKRRDLALFRFHEGAAAAGVFSAAKTPSPFLAWSRDTACDIPDAQAMVAIGGASGAFAPGAEEAVKAVVSATARAVGCRQRDVFLAAVGPVGVVPDAQKIASVLPQISADTGARKWRSAARAFACDDAFPKAASARVEIDGVETNWAALAAGGVGRTLDRAGVSALVFTDAKLDAKALEAALLLSMRTTLNCIDVDTDASPFASVLAFATGAAEHRPIAGAADRRLLGVREAIETVLGRLARLIVLEAPGAVGVIEVEVAEAEAAHAARRIALTVGASPAVQAAIGRPGARLEDRVAALVGGCGEATVRENLRVNAMRFDVAPEDPGAPQARIEIALGAGRARARIWAPFSAPAPDFR